MNFKYILKIFLPLVLICAVTSGLVAGVHILTADKIAENENEIRLEIEKQKQELLESIYGDAEFTVLDIAPEGIDEIRVSDGGEYCVTLTCDGYAKDSIELFVAFDKDLAVLRVSILSSKETTGIGTKVENPEYLSKYEGQAGDISVDKVAGASISSKAVLSGVKRAYAAVAELKGVGDE